MEWVAIDIDIAGDPAVHRIAAALKVRVPEVVGLLTLAFGGMAKHAPDVNIAGVPDTLLETWATWHGKRGTFAHQFRAELCDETGLVRAWEHYNGRNIRRAKAAIERTQTWRARKDAERTERTQNANVTHNVAHNVCRTEQNSTEQNLTANSKEPKGADKPRTVRVRPPRPAAPWMGRMRTAWTFGTLLPGDATLLAPVVGAVGEDETVERMENFCATADPEYSTVRTFVSKHATYASKGRLAVDPKTGLPNEIGMAALSGRR
jgi:hypothetical protein